MTTHNCKVLLNVISYICTYHNTLKSAQINYGNKSSHTNHICFIYRLIQDSHKKYQNLRKSSFFWNSDFVHRTSHQKQTTDTQNTICEALKTHNVVSMWQTTHKTHRIIMGNNATVQTWVVKHTGNIEDHSG